MASKIMRRAQRSAPALQRGHEILEFIGSAPIRKRLREAAARGSVPMTAISADLLRLFGKGLTNRPPIRRFAGLCVRAVLEDEGFELVETGVTVRNDPLFRTGSVYQLRDDADKPDASDLLERFIDCLTEREVARARKLLQLRRQ